MAYEIIREETDPCRCGQGTVVFRVKMDNWNRMRRSFETRCPQCSLEGEIERRKLQVEHQLGEECLQKARTLAVERYLQTWLDRFENCNAKAAWLQYTGGGGYPSLGTFYRHVREFGGVTEYMRWCFSSDIGQALEGTYRATARPT
jgi:hypothetical protein